MSELREKQLWKGTSPEGIAYEIQFWGKGHMCDGQGMWNYYIVIPQDQLRAADWEKVWLPVVSMHRWSSGRASPSYDEYSSILSAGEFHGGITFYEKGCDPDGDHKWIKVGCDYGHLWDREVGYAYSLDYVQGDALRTCKKLAEVLNPLARCTYTGQYFDPRFDMSSDVPGWKGTFLSPAGLGCKSAWAFKDRRAA
jgi:hypothetical protein